MHKVKIVYYEGSMSRRVEIQRATLAAQDPFRPWGFKTVGTFPIIPRPGDMLFFYLSPEDSKYFQSRQDENGKAQIGAEVKFVELTDGEEGICIHCTDQGCGAYGEDSPEMKEWLKSRLP